MALIRWANQCDVLSAASATSRISGYAPEIDSFLLLQSADREALWGIMGNHLLSY